MRYLLFLTVVISISLAALSDISVAAAVEAQTGSDVKLGSLSGSVVGPNENPIEGARITVFQRGPDKILPLRRFTALTDGEGHFAFCCLPLGDYEIQAVSQDPWLTKPSILVSLRNAENALVSFHLLEDGQCAVNKTEALSNTDREAIVNALLEQFFTPQQMDPALVLDKSIVLSTENIEGIKVSKAELGRDLKLVLLSSREIQSRANHLGDFVFLQLEKFEIRGSCVAVRLWKLWADGTSSIETGKRTLQGESSVYFVFRRQSGKWIGYFSGGTIS